MSYGHYNSHRVEHLCIYILALNDFRWLLMCQHTSLCYFNCQQLGHGKIRAKVKLVYVTIQVILPMQNPSERLTQMYSCQCKSNAIIVVVLAMENPSERWASDVLTIKPISQLRSECALLGTKKNLPVVTSY